MVKNGKTRKTVALRFCKIIFLCKVHLDKENYEPFEVNFHFHHKTYCYILDYRN